MTAAGDRRSTEAGRQGLAVQVAAQLAPGVGVIGPDGASIVRRALEYCERSSGVPLSPAWRHLHDVAAAIEAADVSADAHERDRGHADVPGAGDPAASEPWISTAEAAKEAGVTERQIRRWAGAGYLGHVPKVRGALRVSRLALAARLADRSAAS